MIGGMFDSEGSIAKESGGTQIVLNGVTRKFFSEDTINVSDGRIRGKKICSGDWLYQSEIDNISKKKNNLKV